MSCVLNPFMRYGPEIAGQFRVTMLIHLCMEKKRLLRNAMFVLHHRRRSFDVGVLLLVSKKSPSTLSYISYNYSSIQWACCVFCRKFALNILLFIDTPRPRERFPTVEYVLPIYRI